MKRAIPKITISSQHKKILANEHNVSKVAVQNALNYFTNSEKAKAIRKDAIKMLKKEAAKAAVNAD